MMGVTPERAVHAMTDAGAHVVGSNCGNGIDNMVEIARRMRAETDGFLLIHSNAGIPAMRGGQIIYPESPEYMAERFRELADIGVNIVGGLLRNRPRSHPRTGCGGRAPRRGRMATAEDRLRPAEVIERYGQCLELVPLDRRFHDISVGLYVKDGICTIWTFSRKEGVEERIREIRDQMIALGGMESRGRAPATRCAFPAANCTSARSGS